MRRTLLPDAARARLTGRLPAWLVEKVPRDHREPDHLFRRRRRIVVAVSGIGAGLLGVSLSTRPGSGQFYGLTLGVAATWVAGGFASGRLHLGWMQDPRDSRLRRPLVTPTVSGVLIFGGFYGAAVLVRRIPFLDEAITSILRFADEGNGPLVYLTTLANGAAEEVFFRGALFAAVGANYPVAVSTVVYTLATVATRNPALVLAAAVMGTLFGFQRRVTGGIQAPLLTHLTWSALMLRYLPPLFREDRTAAKTSSQRPGGRVRSTNHS